MSDFKELATEVASKGTAPTAALFVLLLTGFLIQNQGPADHRVILETKVVCPSLAELSQIKIRGGERKSEKEATAAAAVSYGLSDLSVFAPVFRPASDASDRSREARFRYLSSKWPPDCDFAVKRTFDSSGRCPRHRTGRHLPRLSGCEVFGHPAWG